MRQIRMISLVLLSTMFCTAYGQGGGYNEDDIRKQLDKYIENPKLYYDKIKSLNERAEKANENTLKTSEEYLSLLDKKDSLIKIYKDKAARASRMASTTTTTTNNAVNAGSPSAPSQQTTTIVTKVKGKTELTPYRVQLAAYFREDFEKFFGNFNKTLGIQKLNNRNVIEVQGFQDEAEALEFSQKIQKLGFPGAFVTKYDENGNREENFATSKTDTKLFSSTSKAEPKINTSKNIVYPDYIPAGYQELMNKKQANNVKATPSALTTASLNVATSSEEPKAKNAPTVKLRAPQVNRNSIVAEAQTPTSNNAAPVTLNKPKNLASAAPVTSPEQSASRPITPKASTPSTSTSTAVPRATPTRDQLDAAFDQLFKK